VHDEKESVPELRGEVRLLGSTIDPVPRVAAVRIQFLDLTINVLFHGFIEDNGFERGLPLLELDRHCDVLA
jgi:hypothetical protein